MQITMVATCLFGLEKLLDDEIDALGLKRIETIDGRVTFLGTEADVARANVWLRTAERVYVQIGRFPVTTFAGLFDGTYALPWEEWIGRDDEFPVTGHSVKSTLFSVPDCQKIIKKAIVNRLGDRYHLSWFPETGVKYRVEFFLFKDEVTLMLDTSGDPLHKRGYRPAAGAAPLRETLASGLVQIAHLRPDVLLWDPFCGSGTIAIEGAMLQANIAPGMHRSFAGEAFANLPAALWKQAKEDAEAAVKKDADYRVYASDIDAKMLPVVCANAVRAGVADHLRIFCADARKIEKENCRGTIICNPPYGERMMDKTEVEALYRDVGRRFSGFAPWQIYVLTSCDYFEKLYGVGGRKRADKVRKLYNGMIPCNLYEYFRPVTDGPKRG